LDRALASEQDIELYSRFEEDGRPRLVPSAVCEFDLLGVSANTEQDAETSLEVTHSALSRLKSAHELPDTVITRWFSDNVVIASPQQSNKLLGDYSPTAVILVAAGIQLELASRGLFGRGGLHYGDFYASQQFVYGPALVAAYQLESRTAVYPRTILSSSFSQRLRKDRADLDGAYPDEVYRDLLAVDADEAVFISYLALIPDLAEPGDEEAWIENHRGHIVAKQTEFENDDHVRRKYDWVASYHNRFCATFSGGVFEAYALADSGELQSI
jgi:hypothetical protein